MTIAIDERSIAPPKVPQAGVVPAPKAAGSAVAMPSQFLSFRLGDEEYGIDILRVQEIRSYEAPTRVAGSPPFVKGVVNLRGLIVPIVDLRMTMGCQSAAYTDFTVVIVLNVGRRVIGAVVDSVSDVLSLAPADIKPVPAMSSSMDAACMMGIGCIRSGGVERMLILTDIDAMMGSAEIGLMDTDLH